MGELHGGFVLPNRREKTIVLGHLVEMICRSFDVLVVNVAGDYAGNYTDDNRRKDSHHSYHLLPSQFNAVALEVVALARL